MALQPGDTFGRYELVSWLGRGGMAETWRAQLVGDAGVTKPVLIKKVLPEYADDEAFISMFISEARISATLSHGNVAQVFDFGRVDGEYFLAMEFVDGQPLHRVLKRALKSDLVALPIPVTVFIAMEMCRGLHYAHTRTDSSSRPLGIVHRDISPDNVLLGYEGQVKIVDFGIAKAQLIRGFKTAPGVVKGKYLFFSPEQARGEEVDARTDVWATGVVLYELLCGRLPVEGPPHVVMTRVGRGEIPAPSVLRPDLPQELNDIVMKALTPDREQRFESSHAFGDALAGFLYSNFPRFSSLTIAHLLQLLFKEELAQQGRELPVPTTFRDEIKGWSKPTPSPVKETLKRSASVQTGHVDVPTPVIAHSEAVMMAAPTSRKWLRGLGIGVLVASASAAMFVLGRAVPSILEAPESTIPTPTEESREAAVSIRLGETLPTPTPLIHPAVFHSRIRELLSQLETIPALAEGKQCEAQYPEDAQCQFLLGSVYALLNRPDDSAAHYHQFLRLAPEDDPQRHRVAETLYARAKPPSPPVEVEPPPQAYDFAQSLAAARKALKDQRTEDALNHYSAAAALRPSSVEARVNLAILQVKTADNWQCGEATELLAKLVVQEPKRSQHWYWLGMAHRCTGKPQQASAALQKYLKLDPRGAEATSVREFLGQMSP
ncbi:protein kinase [Corallococcus exiguus]|uniref:serine/threonine-protein kinase n=1 Tax=Corallococcus exiguus TaxID=83462 RepID=UPI001494BF4E|nr:serine/threonine-protein kinase [Corallococcus exiguus]NPC75882.1 protein kinase [Corallococcus exiguus]